MGSYVKHITSAHLTEQGLRNVGGAVMQLAKVEELEAHRRAVSIRLKWLDEREEGAKGVKFAEAFEICEYGRRPSKDDLGRLFPFFGAVKTAEGAREAR